MATSTKQISISTNLSNGEIIYNYEEFKQSIICKYTNSNYNTLINPVFTTFIDNININEYSTSIVNINNYYSKYAFSVVYNLNTELNRFDDLIFNNCPTLSAVNNIPNSFKIIGKYAFNGCNSLKYINLTDNINEIKEFAFNGTNNLKSLYVPNVTKLHNYSFAGCGIESIELNSAIDTLYHYLFKDCKNLKKFTNDNIIKIGEGVFCGCTNLEYVELSNFSQVYDDKNEYVESTEELKDENTFIGAKVKFAFFNSIGSVDKGIGDVEVIENTSDDDFLSRLIRFVINTQTDDITLIDKTFYVLRVAFDDLTGSEVYQLYDEDGIAVNLAVQLYNSGDDGGDDYKEPEVWRLFDCDDNEIGYITKRFADAIKEYNNANSGNIIDDIDNGAGIEILQFKNPIDYIEIYQDGITPTGRHYNDPIIFRSYDDVQTIYRYQYYTILEDNQEIIDLTDDLFVNLKFNEDYTKCYIKLNSFPVYEATNTYIAYYIFNPFLTYRQEFDENFIYKEGTNNNAFIDLNLKTKYEGSVAKYPVYNINYCILGRLTNGEWLEYTNQTELDTFASKLISIEVMDGKQGTGIYYFMMPQSYNYSGEELLNESTYQLIIQNIETIIGEIIEYKTGTNPFEQETETEIESSDSPLEEEEELITYDKFDLSKLSYSGTKYSLPNMLFASCVKLNNNNIIRKGNYNPLNSKVNIIFNVEQDQNGFYKGKWKDTITFVHYSPSNVIYEYDFNWKYSSLFNEQYINIVLNNKNYYIKEEYDQINNIYIRKLVDNIYDEPNLEEEFDFGLDNTKSIFKLDIFNKDFELTLTAYQSYIYDKYYLLDSIINIGNNSFMNCTSIKSINSKFEKIGDYAFKDCLNLESIVLTRTQQIGKYAFQNCISLKEITLNYLNSNDNKGIFYNCKSLKKVNNFGLLNVPEYFFKNCHSLESINLNQIVSVGAEAFCNCYNLPISFNTMNRINSLGDYAFMGCSKITSIKFNESQNIQYLGKGVFKNCSGLESVVLPRSITNFSEELFACCKNLKTIEFTSQVEGEIKLSAIDFCNNIESIHIPKGGRYCTPKDSCIYDLNTNTIVYVCKNISTFAIDDDFINGFNDEGHKIRISDTAFNNCKLAIIELFENIDTINVNANTFKGIRNKTFHVLIDKKNDPKYDLYNELIGNSHIYFK